MDGDGRKALLVVDNPGGRARAVDAALAALQAGGMTLIRRDAPRERMDELIHSMRKEVDCVVLAGGDGLMSAGAIALRDSGLPLGVLPLGSSNDLARSLAIPLDPAAAAAVIVAGHMRRITLGTVNGRPFFTAASVGLSIEHARALRRVAGRPLGRVRFAVAAFRALMQMRRFSALIRCGHDVRRVRTVQVTVSNGQFFLGGMPGAGLAAGPGAGPGAAEELGVYSLEPETRWSLMFMSHAFTAAPGETVAEARVAHSAVVEVVTRLTHTVVADGEVVTLTPARFGLLPEAVQVFVPEPVARPAPANATAPAPAPQSAPAPALHPTLPAEPKED